MLHELVDWIGNGEKIGEDSFEMPESGGARKSKLVPPSQDILYPVKDAQTLWAVLQKGCKLYGNNRCIGWRNKDSDYFWITYNEFMERSKHFGSGLVNIGMTPGQSSIVGLIGKNSAQWSIAQYGCFSQAAIVIPIYHTLGPEGWVHLIKHTDMQILICEDESKIGQILLQNETLPSLKHIICMQEISKETQQFRMAKDFQFHSFRDVEELGRKNLIPENPPLPNDVSWICFTSGTTGEPKGAELFHKSMIASSGSILLAMGDFVLNERDSTISYLPNAHIFEHLIQTCFLLVGGSFGYYSGDLNVLVEDMKVLQPTFLAAAPRLLNKLYDRARALFPRKTNPEIVNVNGREMNGHEITKSAKDFSVYKPFLNILGGKVRIVFSGAAPIADEVTNFFRHGLGCKMLNAYGQTECCASHVNVITDDTIGSVGPPLVCTIMKLVDVPDMSYYVKNGYGEVCVKGHTVFKGYFKDPQKTAESLDSDGWLHTGDVGKLLPNGHLKIVDRVKHIFKLSLGEFIVPERIESIYSKSSYVSQVYVCGDSTKDYLVAIVVPEKEAVLKWSRKHLKCESWTEVCKNQVLKDIILEDIRRMGKAAGLLSYEQVKNIYLHPEILTFEDGFLTSTLKMRRNFCKEFFKDQIDALYEV